MIYTNADPFHAHTQRCRFKIPSCLCRCFCMFVCVETAAQWGVSMLVNCGLLSIFSLKPSPSLLCDPRLVLQAFPYQSTETGCCLAKKEGQSVFWVDIQYERKFRFNMYDWIQLSQLLIRMQVTEYVVTRWQPLCLWCNYGGWRAGCSFTQAIWLPCGQQGFRCRRRVWWDVGVAAQRGSPLLLRSLQGAAHLQHAGSRLPDRSQH